MTRVPNLFVYGLSKLYVFHDYSTDMNVESFISSKLNIPTQSFYITGNLPAISINARIQGGHSGFGRAMKQEGERRSKHLPENKNHSKTLSGQRIGTLRARKRIIELKQQIKEMEKKREEAKEIKKRLNKKREQDKIEEKEMEVMESVNQAFEKGLEKSITIQDSKNPKPNQGFDIDVSELFEA